MLSETSSPEHEDRLDLQSACRSYQEALEAFQAAFPDMDKHQTQEMTQDNWLSWLLRTPFALLLMLVNIPRAMLAELWEILTETAEDVRAYLGDEGARRSEAAQSERSATLQQLLLDALWARDYVQRALEDDAPVSYQVKRRVLHYLITHDDLLDVLRRRAVDEGELNPIQLRKAQPTPPPAEAWWWYMDNRRTRRARRLNAFWFVAAMIPALAAIILITLLTQRLSIDGPDVLAGASALAQLVLGAGSVLAGRELLNMFFVDRSSGRSWQGEATFALATLFLIVVVSFYLFAPPAAAEVYNWFGQQAIKSGNAAEAELYLKSATRLDPDPHAANLLEVGCLYQTFGSRDQAQNVFERVLEADSRLLLARYYLAEIYTDQEDYETAQQLLTDGINLLGRQDDEVNLPGIEDEATVVRIEYLLKLALGHAHLEAEEAQSAKQQLEEALRLYEQLEAAGVFAGITVDGTIELPCRFDDEQLDAYLLTTRLDLIYFQARTFDAICARGDIEAAEQAWNDVFRSQTYNTRHETYVAEAVVRLTTYDSCTDIN